MQVDLTPLWISLKTASLATGITCLLGLTAAYKMLHYRGRWRTVLEAVFVAPLVLPPTVVGFFLLVLLGKQGLGAVLAPVGGSIVFTWYAAVITATVVAFPLMYRTALGAFQQIDPTLPWAARTLGASEAKVFWRIVLPLALPGVIAGVMLSFARALGEFGATLMLAGNIPGQTQTIPMTIYFAVEAGEMQEAWQWSLAILGISFFSIAAVNGWQRRRGVGYKPQRQGETADVAIANPMPLVAPPKTQPIAPANLLVDLEKQLPGFVLQVRFTANQHPLGVLGASGAGKSLLLRCIAGIETPTSGRIVLNGRALFDAAQQINIPSRDRRVGVLFQNYALFPHLTVAENITFGIAPSSSPAIFTQTVATHLAQVQLQGLGDRYPAQLSGGQQQRVALARALAHRPDVLLLDEPFSALDTHLRHQLERQLTSTLATYAGVTLLVTHNLEEAYRVCQPLLVMEHGRAIAHGSKYDIFERPTTLSVAQLTGCKNFSRAIPTGINQVEAIDWHCTLTCIQPIPDRLAHVGIRAHQLAFLLPPAPSSLPSPNSFACWLTATSETPHRMTVYLKLHAPPTHLHDYHLQAEVFKEKWALLKEMPLPWTVSLDPIRVMLLEP